MRVPTTNGSDVAAETMKVRSRPLEDRVGEAQGHGSGGRGWAQPDCDQGIARWPRSRSLGGPHDLEELFDGGCPSQSGAGAVEAACEPHARPGLGKGIGSIDAHGGLSLIHISEPTRLGMISYAVFCLK